MVIDSLYQHYEQLNEKHLVPPVGWTLSKVSLALRLDEHGSLLGVIPLEETVVRKNKEVTVPKIVAVPDGGKRSVNICPMPLCDGASYFFGVDKESGKVSKRSLDCFNAAKEKHIELLKDVDSPAAKAVVSFFENWNPDKAEKNPVYAENKQAILKASNLVFWFKDGFVLDDEKVANVFGDTSSDLTCGFCTVLKKEAPIARLHPSIKGVRGAQSSGAALVSYNSPSSTSYGKDGLQGLNANISKAVADGYAAALNYLVADSKHYKAIDDLSFVYWAENNSEVCQDVFADFGFGDGEITQSELDSIMRAVETGGAIDFDGVQIPYNNKFYILSFSPNASRLAVRGVYQSSFGDMMARLCKHQKELCIVLPQGKEWTPLPIWKLMLATVPPKSTKKAASPKLASATIRAIISGGRYPEALYQSVLSPIRSEQDCPDARPPTYKVTPTRVAIIKAYLIRNKERMMTVALDETNTTPAYVLGRLFALLEHIQSDANPTIGKTIKDKYFNAAISAPASVFAKLQMLNTHNLRKLENEGRVIWFERQMTDLMGKLDGIPKTLNPEEQGIFTLGYYHQIQKRFEKKGEN